MVLASLAAALAAWAFGCAPYYRSEADRVAYAAITRKQAGALGHTEPFTIETPAQTLRRRLLLDQKLPTATSASLGTRDIKPIKEWPDQEYLKPKSMEDPLVDSFPSDERISLTLTDALQIAAHESRDYQAQKESVYKAALQLDLECDAFRTTFAGVLTSMFQSNLEQQVALDNKGHTDLQTVSGMEYDAHPTITQNFKNGLTLTGAIGVDLATMLTQHRISARGLYADASATLPLLRGSGQFVVTEPLTQAERSVVYAIYTFEHFKHTFAVQVASEYLAVLQQQDRVLNAEADYRSRIMATRRVRRNADAGRSSEIEVDQSRTSELQARQSWVGAQEAYQRRLDAFKTTLGLPVDADLDLDHTELDRLAERAREAYPAEELADSGGAVPAADAPIDLVPPGAGQAGPYELDPGEAVLTAIEHRLDLRVAVGRVLDAERTVAVAADQLQADVTLLGTGSAGSKRTLANVTEKDAILRPDEGSYSALLTVDLALHRTAERNVYRSSLIGLEQSVRDVQDLEDQVKLAVRNGLSQLLEARESMQIQAAAVLVAKRRVDSTNVFLEAGRSQIRDVLEAQDALLLAQNSLTSAVVNYRLGELSLQRDLGVLEVNEKGLWQEYMPEKKSD